MRQVRVSSAKVPDGPPGSFSACKKVGDQVFISGTVAWDKDLKPLAVGDAYGQAKVIFSYMKSLMQAAGGHVDDIVRIIVYVTDIRHQPDVWKARKECFSGDFPCSTLVCVSSLFLPELL